MLDAAVTKMLAPVVIRREQLRQSVCRLRAALLAQLLFLLFVPVAILLALIHHFETLAPEKVEGAPIHASVASADDVDASSSAKTLDERVNDLLLMLDLDEESATTMAIRVQRAHRKRSTTMRPRMRSAVLHTRVDSFLATLEHEQPTTLADEQEAPAAATAASEISRDGADEECSAQENGVSVIAAEKTGLSLSEPPPRGRLLEPR